MIDEVLGRYSGVVIALLGVLMMLDARLDCMGGFLPSLALGKWFVGGVLAGVALFCWIAGWWVFLGVVRYPVAVIVVGVETYALVRYRPSRRGD